MCFRVHVSFAAIPAYYPAVGYVGYNIIFINSKVFSKIGFSKNYIMVLILSVTNKKIFRPC